MNPEIDLLAHRVASALFNGLYQGVLLAGVVWLGFKLAGRINAATRHAVGLVTLLLIAALPAIHLVWFDSRTKQVAEVDRSIPDNSIGLQAGEVDFLGAPSAASNRLFQLAQTDPGGSVMEVDSSPVAVSGAANFVDPYHFPVPPASDLSEVRPQEVLLDESQLEHSMGLPTSAEISAEHGSAGVGGPGVATQAALKSIARAPIWRASAPGGVTLIVLGLIAAIAGLRLVRLGLQFFALGRLKHSGAAVAGQAADIWKAVTSENGESRPARMLASERIDIPMAIGFRDPVVLLPARLIDLADSTGLESVLRHELAHIQRRDDWSNLLQQVIAAFYFFNPAVWWLSRRLTIDREIACDDHALAKSRSRQDYALFLTEFAGRSRGHNWIAAPAAWNSTTQLKERITMILDPKRNASLRLARTSAGLITLATLASAAVAVLAAPRLVLAENSEDRAPAAIGGSAVLAAPAPDARSVVAEPVHVTTTADVAVLRNGNAVTVLPADVRVPVKTRIEVDSVRPTVLIAHDVPPAPEPPEAQPPKGPKPSTHPKPPGASRAGAAPDVKWNPAPPPVQHQESLEKRLERLERMLGLQGAEGREFRGDGKPDMKFEYEFKLKKDAESDVFGGEAGTRNFEWNSENHPNVWVPKEHQALIEKSVKQAEEQVARAMRDAERAMVAQRRAQVEARVAREPSRKMEPRQEERRALEQERRALEQQMRELERQLERLDEQMNRIEEREEKLEDKRLLEELEVESKEVSPEPRVKEKQVEN